MNSSTILGFIKIALSVLVIVLVLGIAFKGVSYTTKAANKETNKMSSAVSDTFSKEIADLANYNKPVPAATVYSVLLENPQSIYKLYYADIKVVKSRNEDTGAIKSYELCSEDFQYGGPEDDDEQIVAIHRLEKLMSIKVNATISSNKDGTYRVTLTEAETW